MKAQNGFTTIELLLAIAVFAITMPTLIASVVSLNTINNTTTDLIYANILAENKIEILRSQGYNSLALGTVSFVDELDDSLSEPRSATYTITQPELGIKQIDVSINYNNRGKNRIQTYSTLISEIGVAQ